MRLRQTNTAGNPASEKRYKVDFLLHQSVWIYVLVFVGKAAGNMVGTIKLILVNRGERFKASVLTLAQMSLFIIITGTVLVGLQDDIWRLVVYLGGATLGSYLGSLIEGKLAFGLGSIQVIVPQSSSAEVNIAQALTEKLRDNGFAVTMLDGQGEQGRQDLLLLHLKRKRMPKAKAIISSFLSTAVIVENDVKMMDGGYVEKK